MVLMWLIGVVSLLDTCMPMSSDIIRPCTELEGPVVNMTRHDGRIFKVYNGECNVTFECCELYNQQGNFMNALGPNGTGIAPDAIPEAEFINYEDGKKCFRLILYPHLSNNGTKPICVLGKSIVQNYTSEFQVEAQNQDTTVTNTHTQGTPSSTRTTNISANGGTGGHLHVWLPIVLLVVPVAVVVVAITLLVSNKRGRSVVMKLIKRMRKSCRHCSDYNPENEPDPERGSTNNQNPDDSNPNVEEPDAFNNTTQDEILPDGTTTSGTEIHEETEAPNGPVAWRTSVYDLRKRRTTQHRSPPAGAVCVSILNCLNFTGEGLTTFDGTMEGSNDLTEKTNSMLVALPPKSRTSDLTPLKGAPHVLAKTEETSC